MKIVADENIPFVNELFAAFGAVVLKAGREITSADVLDADILLVRSVTQVNKALLDGSKVKFVGTCTIGIDHLDTAYLTQHNIAFTSAPGCNAFGVVQYVFSALAGLNILTEDASKRLKVAVVGCGNVGGTILRTLHNLGFDCIAVDPFITPQSIAPVPIKPFEAIYDCDIICTHTPFTRDSEAPTEHLFNYAVFEKLKKGATLLNAGRGGVFNNADLLRYLNQHTDLTVVLDVWEPEPDMSVALLEKVSLGSAHIAGYSYEGRVNGSLIIHDKLRAFLTERGQTVSSNREPVDTLLAQNRQTLQVDSLAQAILATYDLREDDALLRQAADTLPKSFDQLRKGYAKRREFSHYYVQLTSKAINAEKLQHDLLGLGFLPFNAANTAL